MAASIRPAAPRRGSRLGRLARAFLLRLVGLGLVLGGLALRGSVVALHSVTGVGGRGEREQGQHAGHDQLLHLKTSVRGAVVERTVPYSRPAPAPPPVASRRNVDGMAALPATSWTRYGGPT